MAHAPWIVSDGLWERMEPLVPRVQRRFRFAVVGQAHEIFEPLDEWYVAGLLAEATD
jgi:hypothetical protein